MLTACDRVHMHEHMQNEVNNTIMSMGSNKHVKTQEKWKV